MACSFVCVLAGLLGTSLLGCTYSERVYMRIMHVFTCALQTIVVCGGELFTSMCAYTAAAWWEGKVRC
jgi:formate/nitrite transporter FocA (FNT family)